MVLAKYIVFVLIALDVTIANVSACNISRYMGNDKPTQGVIGGDEKFKNKLDPIIGEKFLQCDCNMDRWRVMDEMGFTRHSLEMIFFLISPKFKLLKNKERFIFLGRNPGFPQNVWFQLNTPFLWKNRGRNVTVEIAQDDFTLLETQVWLDPESGARKNATTTYEFSFSTQTEKGKRMRTVTVLGEQEAVCVYQAGVCPLGYRVD